MPGLALLPRVGLLATLRKQLCQLGSMEEGRIGWGGWGEGEVGMQESEGERGSMGREGGKERTG
jgi:hypothetical protein